VKFKQITGFILGIGLVAMTVMPAAAQEAEGDMGLDSAMMANWAKFATPGEHHAHFQKMVGKWTASSTFWMGFDAPAMTSEGTAEFEVIFGGRYLVQHYQGEFMGDVFHGMGITAYDNFRQEYIDLWLDDMGTAIMLTRGKSNEAGTEFTYIGKMDDPLSGRKDIPTRTVARAVDDETHMLEMFTVDLEGNEFKSMEIIYKRTK